MDFESIFDVEVNGKTVLLRVDLNSTVIEGRVMVSTRIRDHAETIDKLSQEGGKLVVLSHQSRPGEKDFIQLQRHANKIRKLIQREVNFVSWEEDFVKAIKEMKNGSILVLDNLRFQSEEMKEKSPEEHSKDKFIQRLASVADYFVEDALSICHRSHASVVGFCPLLPCFIGPSLQKELVALAKLESVPSGRLLILGGAKPEDSVKLMERMLEKNSVDEILLGGLPGELFLKATGIKFGKKDELFEEKGFLKLLPKMKELLEKYGEKLVLPLDLAVAEDGGQERRVEIALTDFPSKYDPSDIGKQTIELFKSKIKVSKSCIFNGPMGIYEKPAFSIGTQKILEQMAFSETYSILGGGDTERALSQLGLLKEDFSHVSLAGKALLQYLSGNNLPGLTALKPGKKLNKK